MWPIAAIVIAGVVAWVTLVGHFNFIPCYNDLCKEHAKQERDFRKARHDKFLELDADSRKLDIEERRKRLESASTPPPTVTTPPPSARAPKDSRREQETSKSYDDSHIPTYYEPKWPTEGYRDDRREYRERPRLRIREREIGVHAVRPGYPGYYPARPPHGR